MKCANEKLFLIKTIQIKNKEKWRPLYADEGQMYNGNVREGS